MMPFAYGAAALLFAVGGLASAAAAIGFARVRLWWGVGMLALLAVMFTGAAISFVQRALAWS
jgi:hypothetical protein